MVCDALAGDIVGDDSLRCDESVNSEHSYSVIASTTVETILINKEDILSYFKVCELDKLGTYSHINKLTSCFLPSLSYRTSFSARRRLLAAHESTMLATNVL